MDGSEVGKDVLVGNYFVPSVVLSRDGTQVAVGAAIH